MKYLIIALALSISGCMSSPKRVEPFEFHHGVETGKSLLYFYQTVKEPFAVGCIIVTVDSKDTECIGNPGFSILTTDPGRHVFSFRRRAPIDTKIKTMVFEYEFEADIAYYLKLEIYSENKTVDDALVYGAAGPGQQAAWVLVPEDVAIEEMKSLERLVF